MSDLYTVTAQFYDLASAYQDRTDKDFYLARAREAQGPVLEIGCGTGRVLLPIAQAGIDITGLDSSPSMLDICRAQAPGAPLVVGDMRAFDLGRRFALITIPFRPFQHLYDVSDQIACLAAVRRHLAPGGRFIFDVFDPNLKGVMTPDGDDFLDFEFTSREGRPVERWVRRLRHDRPRQVLEMEMRFVDKDTRELVATALLTMRYYFRWEVEHLLARCGFQVLDVLGDFDGSPIDARPREMIFISA